MSSNKQQPPDFSKFFEDRIRFMMNEAQTIGASTEHAGLKGAFRELLVRQLLEPLVPTTCRLTRGTVIGFEGRRDTLGAAKTEDDDVLIVDGECLPPFFEIEAQGIYPVESVLARIEVKSWIDRGSVTSAVEGAANFATLHPQLIRTTYKGHGKPIQTLFGFRTECKRPQDCFEMLEEAQRRAWWDGEPPIRLLCIPGVGLWSYGCIGMAETWYHCPSSRWEYTETLAFIAMLLHELPVLREMRRGASLGRYIKCFRENRLVPIER